MASKATKVKDLGGIGMGVAFKIANTHLMRAMVITHHDVVVGRGKAFSHS